MFAHVVFDVFCYFYKEISVIFFAQPGYRNFIQPEPQIEKGVLPRICIISSLNN